MQCKGFFRVLFGLLSQNQKNAIDQEDGQRFADENSDDLRANVNCVNVRVCIWNNDKLSTGEDLTSLQIVETDEIGDVVLKMNLKDLEFWLDFNKNCSYCKIQSGPK